MARPAVESNGAVIRARGGPTRQTAATEKVAKTCAPRIVILQCATYGRYGQCRQDLRSNKLPETIDRTTDFQGFHEANLEDVTRPLLTAWRQVR
jgi:hypothetical protein